MLVRRTSGDKKVAQLEALNSSNPNPAFQDLVHTVPETLQVSTLTPASSGIPPR